MSLVTLQLGQCGNQIGTRFLTEVAGYIADAADEFEAREMESVFFRRGEKHRLARTVLVDMEPKVVDGAYAAARAGGLFRFAPLQRVHRQGGSGNNWALGYHQHGPAVRESVLESVRREAEQADALGGVALLQSLGGGTGSGLGTYLSCAVRDAYGRTPLVNVAVLPYASGEVIVQGINGVLTLAGLDAVSDALLLLENDAVHAMCARLLALERISFDDINGVMARHLAHALLPAGGAVQADGGGREACTRLFDTVPRLCAHPSFKLLTARMLPQVSARAADYSAASWAQITKHLTQMLVADARMEEGIRWSVHAGDASANVCVANLLTLRGSDVASADDERLRDAALYAPWVAEAERLTTQRHAQPLAVARSASLLSNSQSLVAPLAALAAGAHRLGVATGAYAHHYERFGLERADIATACARVEQVCADYQSLRGY